jgi:hypothetical protein
MQSMSFDPAVAGIGAHVVGSAMQAVQAGTAAAPSVTALVPAGGDEVSAQGAMAFAAEATQMLTFFNAAHAELVRTGTALGDIARVYAQTDASAAARLREIHPSAG